MKNRITAVFEQLVKRCPKSGRVVGVRHDTRLARVLFPLLALLALGWFLLRVIPSPRRADYPCQKVAAGVLAGFLVYLAGLALNIVALRVIWKRLGVVAAVVFAGVVLTVGYHTVGLGQATTPKQEIVQVFNPVEGRNHPLGVGKGINPGRVVWAQDPKATTWDGTTGHWWDDQNINQAAVDAMLSQTLQSLSGAKSDAAAWDSLFRHFNRTSGRGDNGYRTGEKIAIKLNCNADSNGAVWGNAGYPSPQVVYAMVRELIEIAGVPGACITLTDPSRRINDILYFKIRSNPQPDFQQVSFADKAGGAAPQRIKAEPDMDCPISFPMPDKTKLVMYLPKTFTEATYLINSSLVRPHRVFGFTMAAKNNFGSVYNPAKQAFDPSALHAFALWDYATPYKHGQPNGLVQLLGHKQLGGKTLLYLADGLYTSKTQSANVVRWSTYNNHWFSSLLMSQDPIALDSVGYDLICSEPNLTEGNASFNGNVDGYLHEAALADNSPSKTKYDPEDDGTVLTSLGVHEHWNSNAEKKYSRNLGKKDGIELIRISAN
jgi:hypothetical protein